MAKPPRDKFPRRTKSGRPDRRKPPKASQFKKGKSGNPKGRPNGTRNFEMLFNKEMDQKIWVGEGDQRRKISKRELLIRQTVNKGISGHFGAQQRCIETMRQLEGFDTEMEDYEFTMKFTRPDNPATADQLSNFSKRSDNEHEDAKD